MDALDPAKLKIELRGVESLIPHARNSRTHTDAQIAQIAASIKEFGWTNPVLVDGESGIVAGHGRVLAARKLGQDVVPVIELRGMTELQKRAYVIADNKLALNAGWDSELLAIEFAELEAEGFDVGLIGFTPEEIAAFSPEHIRGMTEDDAVPSVSVDAVSRPGDVWLLGKHRVMCGDSTSLTDVAKLVGDEKAALLHSDPPYGMGKEADGVANDNLYRDELAAFQMDWWAVWRTFMLDNASAYIWGNAPDLWRLWYRGGLADSEQLELRNEIVWDKKSIPGMGSDLMTQYAEASERCLYFQVGNQFIGNVNADDFPEHWEPLRSYMEGEATKAGIKAGDIVRVCGCGMFGHWFSRSQFCLIPERHYAALRKEYPGRFLRPWSELKTEWANVRGSARDVINEKLGISRSYFDNAHDTMRDVWEFSRVIGEERFGHATPKPVAMMERIMKSSLQPGGLCLEPFAGSGSTLIGAEKSGRVCYTMELQALYVDVTVRRWQQFTGQKARHEASGATFEEVEASPASAVAEVA